MCAQARGGPFIVQIFVVSRGHTSYNMQEFIFFVSLVECKAELDRIDSRLSQIQQSSDDFRLDFQQSAGRRFVRFADTKRPSFCNSDQGS